MRYIPGIKAGMRIVYNSSYYDISSVIDPEEQHRELHIMATTGLSDG
jgi:SPP1 family predicted phage head-tail adaptor